MNFEKSELQYQRACQFMPGGVNSPVRAFKDVNCSPIFINRASGSKIYDLNDNEFIDYVCSWGPAILGHAQPDIIQAICKAATKGTSFGAPTIAETELAEKMTSAIDSVEKVRLVNSGTEAVMTAVRLARGYTRKNIIIKMEGGYHGHSDSLLASAGSGLADIATSSSAGVPDEIAAMTVVLPFNDLDAVEAAFRKHKNHIAALLVEPIPANMGVIPPKPGYLDQLRTFCDNENALLIFDEVITGFRVAFGGAQQLYNIKPDLTCLGKIIGAGMPLAAFGGKKEIMDKLAPLGPVYQAGTLSGNPLATAAANAALDLLKNPGVYKKLEDSAARLQSGLESAAKKAGIPCTINRVGSIMSPFFTKKSVENFKDVKNSDINMFKTYFSLMLNNGIYLAPSAFEAMFVSTAHSEQDIDKTIKAATNSFGVISSSA